jgi:aarF domain-containing kinase
MRLIEFDDGGGSSSNNLQGGGESSSSSSSSSSIGLPYIYDPIALEKFFIQRPQLIVARIFQVLTTGGGVLFNFAFDTVTGRMKNNPELEVQRTAQLCDKITSLGPFFIKLGQALSIRPDILSPRSMIELQKLCDKVPTLIQRLLMLPWNVN